MNKLRFLSTDAVKSDVNDMMSELVELQESLKQYKADITMDATFYMYVYYLMSSACVKSLVLSKVGTVTEKAVQKQRP